MLIVILFFLSSTYNRFVGGVPTSMEPSGQQWDYPNGWAPLQVIIYLLAKLIHHCESDN